MSSANRIFDYKEKPLNYDDLIFKKQLLSHYRSYSALSGKGKLNEKRIDEIEKKNGY